MRGDITEQFVLFIINIGVDKMKPTYYAYNPKGAAKYAKDKGLGDTAEKKRQSAMVMEADLNDQSKGAEDYINKKYGSIFVKDRFGADAKNYIEFENELLDVVSEGETSSKYPKDVWERGARSISKKLWKSWGTPPTTLAKTKVNRQTPSR